MRSAEETLKSLTDEEINSFEGLRGEQKQWLKEAKLGQQALDFLNSDVGAYLHECAKKERDEASLALTQVNPYTPWGRMKWRKEKLKYEIADSFIRWMAEALINGRAAQYNWEMSEK